MPRSVVSQYSGHQQYGSQYYRTCRCYAPFPLRFAAMGRMSGSYIRMDVGAFVFFGVVGITRASVGIITGQYAVRSSWVRPILLMGLDVALTADASL